VILPFRSKNAAPKKQKKRYGTAKLSVMDHLENGRLPLEGASSCGRQNRKNGRCACHVNWEQIDSWLVVKFLAVSMMRRIGREQPEPKL